MRTRLDSRLSQGRFSPKVDSVGRSAGKRSVRAMLIVPIDETKYLSAKLVTTQRDEDPSSTFVLDSPDHSLHNSDTAMLADCPIPDTPTTWRQL